MFNTIEENDYKQNTSVSSKSMSHQEWLIELYDEYEYFADIDKNNFDNNNDKYIDMEENNIQCNECGWTGDDTMLVSTTEAMDDPCNKCPDCGSGDIEEIIE